MEIVGIQDIGPLGSSEGEPVLIYWPVYFHLVRLIPALIVVLLLLRAPNRTRSAWWILLPAVLLPVLSSWILELSVGTPFIHYLHDGVVLFLFAAAFLWLLADKITDVPRLDAFFRAAGLLLLAGVIGLFAVSVLGPGLFLIPVGFVYAVLAFTMLVALALAGVACRKQYSPGRFLFWLFASYFGGFLVIMFLLFGCVLIMRFLLMGFDSRQMIFFLPGVLLASMLAGWVLVLPVLPYIALALGAPAYRARFHGIFRLPGMVPEEDRMPEEHAAGDCEP